MSAVRPATNADWNAFEFDASRNARIALATTGVLILGNGKADRRPVRLPVRTSELQTQLELDVPLSTRLRCGYLTELGILQVVVRGRKLRSVPDVGRLRPEL